VPRAALTPMQVSLLQLLARSTEQRLSLAQAGARLGYSVDQIDREMSKLRKLTGARSRWQLIEWWKLENRRVQ
jgi:hypothetical protein